jgi:hypothetical protein
MRQGPGLDKQPGRDGALWIAGISNRADPASGTTHEPDLSGKDSAVMAGLHRC